MGVTRYLLNENPSPIIGKSDFEFYYSETIQPGDDNKIPAKTKSIDVSINRLDVYIKVAPVGQDAKVTFYKDGVSLGQVTVTAGTKSGTLSIPLTLVTAGSVMTITIDQVGSSTFGVDLSAWARVAA